MLRRIIRRMNPITLSRGHEIVRQLVAAKRSNKSRSSVHWYDTVTSLFIEYLAKRTASEKLDCHIDDLEDGDWEPQTGDIRIADVTPHHCTEFYLWLTNKPHAKDPRRKIRYVTVYHYMRSFRAYWNHLVTAGHLDVSPAAHLHLPRPPKKERKDLAEKDYKKMLRACTSIRDEALLMTLWHTGGRLNAVANIRTDKLFFEEYEKDGQSFLRGRALAYDQKVSKLLWLYFDHDCAVSIGRYMKTRPQYAGDYLWISIKGGRLHPSGIVQILKRIRKRSEVARGNAHSFRHAKVKRLIAAGAPHKIIQDLMGWESDAMIQEYVQHMPDELQAFNSRYGVPVSMNGENDQTSILDKYT